MDPMGWKGGLKAQWAMAIHNAMEKIKEDIPKFEWPFMVLHGDADQLAMVEGSKMLEQKAASKDKTIKVGWWTFEIIKLRQCVCFNNYMLKLIIKLLNLYNMAWHFGGFNFCFF